MRTVWVMAVLLLLGGACTRTPVRRQRVADGGVDAGPKTDGGGPPDAGQGSDGGSDDGGAPADAGITDGGLAGTWERLGPPLGLDAQVYPAMAMDLSGRVLVAYADLLEQPGTTTTELRVVRWSGQTWEPVGEIVARSENRMPFSAPLWVRLTTDGSGRPVLVVGDSGAGSTSGAFPASSWMFDGTAWRPMRVPGGAEQLGGLAVGRDADGRVQLALSTGRTLGLYTLGPDDWTPDGASLAIDGGISEPDVAPGEDGSTLLAFSEALAPGSFGALRAWRHTDAGWVDLRLPSPQANALLFHSPRVRGQPDGGAVVAVSEWQYDPIGKTQIGVAVPVFRLGEGGWSRLDDDGAPGGFGLSEPIPGSPVGLQLSGDVPVAISTNSDGGVVLRAFTPSGSTRMAPVLGGVGAGTLLLMPDGTAVVGAVTPLQQEPGPRDGGQVQLLHFTGAVTGP